MADHDDIGKLVKQYERSGLIVIKLTNDELLDGCKPVSIDHKVWTFPDKKLYIQCLKESYKEQLSKESKPPKIDVEHAVDEFFKKYQFPSDMNHVYAELPLIRGNIPQGAYIHMLTTYKEGLDSRMKDQGFSEESRYALGMIAEETLINAFKHGNRRDMTKNIEVFETYMKGQTRHGYLIIVRDSGLTMLTKEMIDIHKQNIDPATGKPKLTTSKRGFVLIDLLSDRAWALPYSQGNSIAIHKFEQLPKVNGANPTK